MAQPSVVQIPALTGIRILAALGVVVCHFSDVAYGLFPDLRRAAGLVQGGYLGVEMFFILSGFIISHNYAARFRCFSALLYLQFLRNRLARIYPVHVFTLCVVISLVIAAGLANVKLNSDGKYDFLSFIMNLALLQSLPPAWSWNGPAWSISAEFGAYFAFPLLGIALSRIRDWKTALLISLVTVLRTSGNNRLLASILYTSYWSTGN